MPSQLKNPPLVEALLEIKWELNKAGPDAFEDPGYKLASGRLFDRVKKRFGYIQNLPITIVPEELTAYAVRNQFRTEANGWPLVQIGPGVATVNMAPPYTWKKFKDTIKFFVPILFDSYTGVVPGQPDYQLHLNSALLRYINGIEWDWEMGNTLEFLQNNLHTSFSLPKNNLAADQDANPLNLNLQIGYPINEPKGQVIIRFATGTVGQSKGLVLELLFLSAGDDVPQLNDIDGFMKWVNDAHTVLEQWFFSLIKGELHKRFKGE
jgi:uncharacterized protein (TIGR04255 family)